MSEDRYDNIIGQISNLNGKVEDFIGFARMHFEQINEDVTEVKKDMKVVKSETSLTNSRVTKLEDKHSPCPAVKVSENLKTYKNEMRTVHMLATNWKVIATIVISTGFVIQAFEWVSKLIEHFVSKLL